jgi:hypothetical protein
MSEEKNNNEELDAQLEDLLAEEGSGETHSDANSTTSAG